MFLFLNHKILLWFKACLLVLDDISWFFPRRRLTDAVQVAVTCSYFFGHVFISFLTHWCGQSNAHFTCHRNYSSDIWFQHSMLPFQKYLIQIQFELFKKIWKINLKLKTNIYIYIMNILNVLVLHIIR